MSSACWDTSRACLESLQAAEQENGDEGAEGEKEIKLKEIKQRDQLEVGVSLSKILNANKHNIHFQVNVIGL